MHCCAVSKDGPLEKLFGSMRVGSSGATPQASPQVTGFPPFKNADANYSPLRQPSTPNAAPLSTPTGAVRDCHLRHCNCNPSSTQQHCCRRAAPSTRGGSVPMPPATQLPTLLKPSFFQTPTGAATARVNAKPLLLHSRPARTSACI